MKNARQLYELIIEAVVWTVVSTLNFERKITNESRATYMRHLEPWNSQFNAKTAV